MSKVLFISDLDGTLLDPSSDVTDVTAEKLNRLIKKGMNFSVATARSVYSVKPKMSSVDMNIPCILMNGVNIYDLKNDSFIKNEFIAPAASAEILKAFENHGKNCFMYRIDNGILTCYYSELITDVMKNFAEVRKYEYKKPFVKCRLEDYADEYSVYFTSTGSYDELLPVKLEIEKIKDIDSAFYLDVYNDAWYLEVFSHRASKSNGIKFLREKYGFDKVVAFGDNLNDLPMFAQADFKIAVGNARDEVKSAADIVIGDNKNNGVAEWLENNFDKI
ncbi:MAG: HAD family phosphatase [Ruminococcus sp.]|nr:HAD family phosphatase [Ruminococcus sp.]MBR6386478.1 HAD family phosphatase [Ruminococcus sp.]